MTSRALPTIIATGLPAARPGAGGRRTAPLPRPLDSAIVEIARAIARQMAREDHERELQAARKQ